MYKVRASKYLTGNLASPLNFARFYFDSIFPNIDTIIYLDVDTIVQTDIIDLYEMSIDKFTEHEDSVIIASKRYGKTPDPNGKSPFKSLVHELYSRQNKGKKLGKIDKTKHPLFTREIGTAASLILVGFPLSDI